jgi:hypothetical protein
MPPSPPPPAPRIFYGTTFEIDRWAGGREAAAGMGGGRAVTPCESAPRLLQQP